MENFLNWLDQNKAWLFEGLGASILIGVFVWLWNKNKNNNNDPKQSISGNRNYQAGRDIHINSEKKTQTRPILEMEIQIEGKGNHSIGVSAKNPTDKAIFVTEVIYDRELIWDYVIKIVNTSSVTAYSPKIKITNNPNFNYIENLQSLEPITSHNSRVLKANYIKRVEMNGYDSNKSLSKRFAYNLEKLEIILEYYDEERNLYKTRFYVDENQQQHNEIIH